MPRYLKVAQIFCSGKSNSEGRLEDPYIDIIINPDNIFELHDGDRLSYRIDVLTEDIILKIPITYREATLNLDHPSFNVILLDDNNTELYNFDVSYPPTDVRDTYNQYDTINDIFEYRIPIKLLEENKTKIFNFNIKATLEQWEWEEGEKGKKLDTLVEKKSFIVSLTVLSTIPVSIVAYYTAGGWNEVYNIKIQIDNQLNEKLDYELTCIESSEEFPTQKKNICIKRTSIHPDFLDYSFINPGSWDFITINIKKNWNWLFRFETAPPPLLYLVTIPTIGPIEKTFNYTIKFTIFKTIDVNDTVSIINYTFQPILLKKTVKVSPEKVNYAERSLKAFWDGIAAVAKHIVLSSAVSLTCLFCIYPAAVALATAISFFKFAIDYRELAEDPIIFDPEFKLIFDYHKLVEKVKNYESLPFEMRAFTDSLNQIRALNKTVNITSSRYYSALKLRDTKSAHKQVLHSEELRNLLEDELINLHNLIEDFKRYENQVNGKLNKEKIKEALEKVKREGIPEEIQENLLKEGFQEIQFTALKERISQFDTEKFDFNIYEKLTALYLNAVEDHFQSREKIKNVKKLESFSKNDIQRELLRQQLISYDEYLANIDTYNYEMSYLIDELKSITPYYKKKLAKRGIFTTLDLIENCSNESQMIRFAKTTKMSLTLIKKWVRLVKIMSIKGVGEEYAKLLIKLGYNNLNDLSVENVEILSKKIKKYSTTKKKMKYVPSEKEINTWVRSAKFLNENKEGL